MPKDKNPGMPTGSKKVPIIGQKFTEKDNEIINAAVQAIVQKVEPILNGIGGMVDAMDKRVAVLEEVKKIFPDKVEVVIRHAPVKYQAHSHLEGEIIRGEAPAEEEVKEKK